jgi:D-psicose/D-tagatose/L-ribulose 3-epimerase
VKLGISAFAWTGSLTASHIDLLPRVSEYGFTGFEIPMFEPASLPLTALRHAFAETGLDCTVCAILPPGINPISPDPAVRKRSLTHLAACVDTAAEIGAHLLGGPMFAPIGYLPGHRRTDDEWQWAVEAIQSLGDKLTTQSIVLSLEPVNRSETFFLRTAAEARRFCEAVAHPMVGVTIDTFHANIEEKSIPAAIDLLGPTLKHVHMSENDRGPLGSGHIDFAGIMTALKRTTYNGYLIVEGFGFAANEPSAPGALWADKTVSPETLAMQGRRFLEYLIEH